MGSGADRSAFVEECFEAWTSRFIANGVDGNDLGRLRDRIETWAEWCPAFRDLGEAHAGLGESALDRGDTESAGEHFRAAAMVYHFGSHVWHEDDRLRDETHRLAVECFGRAGPHLDPPVERLEATTAAGFEVVGNLRVPEAGPDGAPGESPVVILLPGLDSIKEELSAYDPYFHARGLATLAVDGPGQGETWYHHGMTDRYHRFISAVIDRLESHDPAGVDPGRLATLGVSLGGFYAPQVAAFDDRVDACVGISGPFVVGPASKYQSALHREQFLWACQTDSLVEADEITEAMSLREVIEDLRVPSLMVTGGADTIVHPAETERIAARAPGGEFLLYEDAGHVCNDIPYEYKPRVADWLRSHLA